MHNQFNVFMTYLIGLLDCHNWASVPHNCYIFLVFIGSTCRLATIQQVPGLKCIIMWHSAPSHKMVLISQILKLTSLSLLQLIKLVNTCVCAHVCWQPWAQVSSTMSLSQHVLQAEFCCHAATQSHSIILRSIKRCGYPGRRESCLSFHSHCFFPSSQHFVLLTLPPLFF